MLTPTHWAWIDSSIYSITGICSALSIFPLAEFLRWNEEPIWTLYCKHDAAEESLTGQTNIDKPHRRTMRFQREDNDKRRVNSVVTTFKAEPGKFKNAMPPLLTPYVITNPMSDCSLIHNTESR